MTSRAPTPELIEPAGPCARRWALPGIMAVVAAFALTSPASAAAATLTVTVTGTAPEKVLTVTASGGPISAAVRSDFPPNLRVEGQPGDTAFGADCANLQPHQLDCGPLAAFARVVYEGGDAIDGSRASPGPMCRSTRAAMGAMTTSGSGLRTATCSTAAGG